MKTNRTYPRAVQYLVAIALSTSVFAQNQSVNGSLTVSDKIGINASAPDARLEIIEDTIITSELDYGLRIKDPSSSVGLLLGVSQNAGASVIQSFQPGVTWGSRPLSLMPNGGRVSVGTTNALGLLTVWNTNVYDGGETNWAADSIALYGAVDGGNGGYFGGITWQNGGRRRAGIASVMEHGDSDHVGLAFFTQGTDGAGPMFESMRIAHSGRVGIGTKFPEAALDVIRPGNANVYENGIRANRPDVQGQYAFMGYGQSSADAYFGSVYTGSPGYYGSIHLRQYAQGMAYRDVLNIDKDGKVGIGTTAPSHALSVNGAVKAKEVIVETSGWSDFVFGEDYELTSLSEVEEHIRRHRHLPGVPSAEDVAAHGISVGEMQAKLLEKIEELTLHLIAHERYRAEQESRLDQQSLQIAELREQLETLRNAR